MKGVASSSQQLTQLLWDIISTAVSSAFYSITLAFRAANGRRTGPSTSCIGGGEGGGKPGVITFYQGTVWHERKSPVHHKFAYHVRYVLVNLDSAPPWFNSTDHMTAPQARSIAGTTGTVYLLMVPESVGYEQNPLNVYYCFNDDETCLSGCIAEVTNTPWGERVTFLFDPNGDIIAKPLHVSPFMDMLGTWRIKACVPDRNIMIRITVQHPEHGNYFTASLSADRVECPPSKYEGFFWLMPHKIVIGIYWQAFLLWWKGVRFYPHPKYVDGDAYRERAIQRDQEILKEDAPSPCSQMLRTSRSKCTRSFTWYEAHWPWA